MSKPNRLALIAAASVIFAFISFAALRTPSEAGLTMNIAGSPTPTPTLPTCHFSNGGLNPQSVTESGQTAGFSSTSTISRLADDFTLPEPCLVHNLVLFGYQPGGPLTSPFVAYTLRIWHGIPGEPDSTIVFGDTSTNRLISSVDFNTYRILNTVVPPGNPPGTTRRIWRNTISVGTPLSPGTYWIDWDATVIESALNFHPSKTIPGSRGSPGDNARRFNVSAGIWSDVLDVGSPVSAPDIRQDFPFLLEGDPSSATPTPTPTPTPRVQFDYDADGRTDFSIFRASERNWYLQKSTEGFLVFQFGISTDKIVPADYDGDGRTDIAVFRPSERTWYIANSSNGTFSAFFYGLEEDIPMPGDFDGDGEADLAVFRPFDGTWYWRNSSNGQYGGFQLGQALDKPMLGDFDGDGRTDLAVFRPANGHWYIKRSSDGAVRVNVFGLDGDIPLNGDFNGNGRADLAVFRPSDRTWYIARPTGVPGQNFDATQFGVATDLPVPGDYDGDGRTDISVFRPSDGHWYRQNSSNGSFSAYHFGVSGDRPTPTAFH